MSFLTVCEYAKEKRPWCPCSIKQRAYQAFSVQHVWNFVALVLSLIPLQKFPVDVKKFLALSKMKLEARL